MERKVLREYSASYMLNPVGPAAGTGITAGSGVGVPETAERQERRATVETMKAIIVG